MKENRPQPDPPSRFEDEGIPDLQEGTPERLWAEDPVEMPLPGDRPMGVDEYGTTPEEMAEGEPLDMRLAREVPDVTARLGRGFAGDEPADALDEDDDVSYDTEEPRPAGRLVDPSLGVREDTEDELIADEIGPDGGGYAPEEAAVRVVEDRRL